MARPLKNNAEWFKHDANMRNHPKVKALRKRFGIHGYAIFSMLIEYLADRDNFTFELTDLNLELICGDFDIDKQILSDVIEYCIILGLLQSEGNFIICRTLNERLSELLRKRKPRKLEVSASETHKSDSFRVGNTQNRVEKNREEYILTALCLVFGKQFKQAQDRMPAEASFYKDIEVQYDELIKAYDPQTLNLQVMGYIKHCDQTGRKRIGTTHKLAETILSSDWVVLNGDSPIPIKTDLYSEARRNRSLWTLQAWEDHYADKIAFDKEFKKEFGYDQLREGSAMGGNAQSRKSA